MPLVRAVPFRDEPMVLMREVKDRTRGVALVESGILRRGEAVASQRTAQP